MKKIFAPREKIQSLRESNCSNFCNGVLVKGGTKFRSFLIKFQQHVYVVYTNHF